MVHLTSHPNLFPPPPWRPRLSDFVSLPAVRPYRPPAIIYSGRLETRAGSPTSRFPSLFQDPSNPLYGQQ